MYAIYGNIYHYYTPNVSIYTIYGSYGYMIAVAPLRLQPQSHAGNFRKAMPVTFVGAESS